MLIFEFLKCQNLQLDNMSKVVRFKFGAVVLLFLVYFSPQAQEREYKALTIAAYNLENLFDTINDPNKRDHQNPIGEMSPEEARMVYSKKLANMAKVIADIGTKEAGFPPAIVGVSEIENYKVLEDLVNQPRLKNYNYGIVHYDSPDRRSIDVALIYRKDVFKPLYHAPHEVVLYDRNDRSKRRYTRDVLYVKGLLDGEEIHFLVNHWPSRSGGEKSSRPSRVKAAQVAKGIIDSIQKVEPEAKIMLMGDLNDGPYNESVKVAIGAIDNRDKLEVPYGIYNPYEAMYKKGAGTIAWRDGLDVFDQIMFTQPLTRKDDFSSYRYYKAFIFNPPYLITPRGRWKGYPYRSFANGWTGGYSDHYPVYVILIKEKE